MAVTKVALVVVMVLLSWYWMLLLAPVSASCN